MKWILMTGLWFGTLAAAFLVGRGSTVAPLVAPEESDLETVEDLRAEVAHLRREVRLRPTPEGGSVAGSGSARAGGGRSMLSVGDTGPFSFEGIESGRGFSEKLMAFVDGQLERGPEGFQAILDALALLTKSEDRLQALFPQEEGLYRELYPWLRFSVEREEKMVDLTEYVFKTMAVNPDAYREMDDDPLELFTEAFAILLPGAIPNERLNAFRGYAARILETPEAQQPRAIQRNRREIKRALERYWAEPMSAEDALAKLRSGNLNEADAIRLLAALGPEELAQVDVNGLLAPLLEAGRFEAVRTIQTLPEGVADIRRLDASVLAGMEKNSRGWFVRNYLDATGRQDWDGKRAFLDGAFLGGEKLQAAAAQVLSEIGGKVTPEKKAYVADVLRRYSLPQAQANRLKQVYGIE